MFSTACERVRESIYGILGSSRQHPSGATTFNAATGYMIAPGILATVAHACHQDGNAANQAHDVFQLIRCPEIGGAFEAATLIAEDPERDIAFLQIHSPRNTSCVALYEKRVPIGTSCGALGFPLSGVITMANGQSMFNLVERFQGAAVSAYNVFTGPSGRQSGIYETDAISYPGSSGCPAFLRTGEVFAMIKGSLAPGDPNPGPVQAGAPFEIKASTGLTNRLSISVWVPADEIAMLARQYGLLR